MLLSKSALLAACAYLAEASGSCTTIDSNTYCSAVEQITYENVGFSGSYNKITDMLAAGTCSSSSYSFSGALAPLHEEVSIHFRGPLNLKKFAHYTPSSSNSKRDAAPEPAPVKRDHVHHLHKREPVLVTAFVDVTTTVFVGGEQQETTSSAEAAAATEATTINTVVISSSAQAAGTTSTSSAGSVAKSSAQSSAKSSSTAAASGDLTRSSYYDASSQTDDNLVFMNNLGGSGSGVFSYVFGNSISYAGADGVSCASEPTCLDDVTIASNKEYMLFTKNECSDSDECAYYRPGIDAYHGFSTPNSVFVFEFLMPHESASGYNADMPALWFLNAEIPKTLQYGTSTCSCWSTGCGEFDAFEVLSTGLDYLTNHLHTGQGATSGEYGGGGSTSYFTRPTSEALTAAVYFDSTNSKIVITTVPSSFDWDSSISTSDVESWISQYSGSSSTVTIAS